MHGPELPPTAEEEAAMGMLDEDDIVEGDDDEIEAADESEEEDDDFLTMKESEMNDEEAAMYEEGQILQGVGEIKNDAVCQLSLCHQDHVYCVTKVPTAPFNTFISGDGNDKCFVW